MDTRNQRQGAANVEFGRQAEEAAAEWLLTHGYIIRERNWSPRGGHNEIDIIAQQDMVIVFVEVKARHSDFMDPIDAVTPEKVRKLARCADSYLSRFPQEEAYDFEYRFDIITVTGEDMQIEHISDAFMPPLSTY